MTSKAKIKSKIFCNQASSERKSDENAESVPQRSFYYV